MGFSDTLCQMGHSPPQVKGRFWGPVSSQNMQLILTNMKDDL